MSPARRDARETRSPALERVLAELRSAADPDRLPGMARVGIATEGAIGVPIPVLRRIARAHRSDHDLALGLWGTGIHEARILASMVDDPGRVTRTQMEGWVGAFDSWDLCDQVTANLFTRTPEPLRTARTWVDRDEGFVRRAGFAMIAELAYRDRTSSDRIWEQQLPLIRRGASDPRNEVKRAVSWALRQIGKRNLRLNARAIAEAESLLELGGPDARWIARDALRELRSEAVQDRLGSS
jgi:3-methyladenine DNA glycosylase AlkD